MAGGSHQLPGASGPLCDPKAAHVVPPAPPKAPQYPHHPRPFVPAQARKNSLPKELSQFSCTADIPPLRTKVDRSVSRPRLLRAPVFNS